MSKPANKTVIGIFVVGAIALVVIAIVVLGSGKFFKEVTRAVCYFEGSVGGLSMGAPVVFRGVKIGSVTDVVFRYDPTTGSVLIPVFFELERKRKDLTLGQQRDQYQFLIDKGLRARLDLQSFVTGQRLISLDFYPDKPAKFVGADPEYFEVPTIPTPLQELTKKIEQLPLDQIAKDIASAVEGINRLVNSPELPQSLGNIARAAEDLQDLLAKIDARIEPLVTRVEATIEHYGTVARTADEEVKQLASNIRDLAQATVVTVQQAEKTLRAIEDSTAKDSLLAYEISQTLDEVSAAARSMRYLVDYLERHPEALLRGKSSSGGK